jgi:hypothetical protein
MMTERTDRRTIAELQARYELEPSLRDVYVEGPSDRTLVELALTSLDQSNRIRAYEVDTVYLPKSLLEARSLPHGNKGRVLALADELAIKSTRDLRRSAVCLADLDLDEILGTSRNYPLLVYTAAMSLDVVLTGVAVVRKLLSVVLLGFPQPAERLLEQLLPVLNERVLHRLAAMQLGILVEPPALVKSCMFDGLTLRFRSRAFVRKYLEKAGVVSLESQFLEIVERHRAEISRERWKYVHMDDFFALLHLCVRKVKPKLVPDHSRFRRFMFGLVEGPMVAELPEMQEIIARFKDGNAAQQPVPAAGAARR